MDTIQFRRVLPHVFAGREDTGSEIWLREVNLQRGKRYLVDAQSGTGKSSMCSYIFGYRVDYSGTIAFDDVDTRQLSVARWCDIRQRHIAYLPQEMRLFPELTVLENINLKNRLTNHKTASQIADLLQCLGVEDKANSLVAHLSIGQQQRVAFVRTLCQPAEFFLLDEPVSHLDNENNSLIARLVSQEADALGAAIIVTSVGNHLNLNYDLTLKM